MAQPPNIDGVLITWGDRLFYPGNRVVRVKPQPRLIGDAARLRAAAIRKRIKATVVRRAPQVMVKVTGGGRGMRAIAAHFRYISKNGRLEIEDQHGETMRGKDTLSDLADEWRFGGSLIPEDSEPGHRREAYNIMLSMPHGTDPLSVRRAAREFAQVELAAHKYVMVMHDHQANPHVHISVRAESKHGKRLNPRKADLHRWRETFAEKLRGHGIDAEATRQATRGRSRNYDPLWRLKAREDGRLRITRAGAKSGARARATRAEAVEAWMRVGRALAMSGDAADRDLARSIATFIKGMPTAQMQDGPKRSPEVAPASKSVDINQRR
ncbi:MAG: conjugal transfer protein TraS [Comamonadaceae bacterium]|nr:MAG: conjugal transfer protein TraS [Comamonadaceae bacterium]